jgi:TolA-binding protein
MKRRPSSSMRASVQAFRALTAAPGDGTATRARVLARAGRSRSRRVSWGRVAALALAATGVSISASAAWTRFGPARPAALAIVVPDQPGQADGEAPRRRHADLRPALTIPVEAPDKILEGGAVPPAAGDADLGGDADGEARAYARAHRAHFVDQVPTRALAAWNDYLRRFPRGALAPEAQFNRALCLVRLGRFDASTRALHAFAANHPDGYRKADVERLLAWLRDRA